MAIIYRKTAKGTTEFETREHRLAPRVRSALIVVDGRRDADALKALIAQQADEVLALLLEQGFIEAVGESPTSATAPAALARSPLAQAAPAAAVQAAPGRAGGPPADDFAARRRAAVRDVNDVLGPAGESLAIRMERARDATELRPLVQLAVQVIGTARGRAAAEAYSVRHEG